MREITLPCVEIMLVFPRIETSVVFLNNFSLLVEKLALFVLHFFLFLIHKLATANIAPPHSLYFQGGPLLVIELPLDLKHPPVFLDNYSSCVFFVAEFFGLIKHCEILIYEIPMTALTFF